MKKTLVALAALASVSAFAQSSVTLDGYMDRGYVVTNNTNTAKSSKAVGSNAGTTTIGIKVTQDLGAGLKANVSISTDWADAGGLVQDGSAASTTPTASGSFGNSQNFINLQSATFGTIALGNINNEVLTAVTGVAGPAFSTGVGSAYSSAWSVHNGFGTGVVGANTQVTTTAQGATGAGVRGIRQVNTVKYTSPNVAGFVVNYGETPLNDQGSAGTGDTVGAKDYSLRYTNGPLDVIYAGLKYTVGANAPANGSLTAGSDITHTTLGASYQVLPVLKLHAGLSTSKSNGLTTNIDTKSTQYGVTYNVTPVIDAMFQVAKADDRGTGNFDRKMTGFGVDYKFSKTTRAYLRYDSLNLDSAHAASSGSEIKRTAVGLSTSF